MKPIPQFEPSLNWRDAWAAAKCVLSGYVGPGKHVAEFEAAIADWYGAKHCVCTTSGTTALMLSLMALELAPGSTVLFPAYTMLAGANAAKLLGFKVRLVDVDPRTLAMEAESVERILMADLSVSCVIFVEHNGSQNTVIDVVDVCGGHGVPLIRDACQSFGFQTPDHSIGDVTVVSFSPQKIVTTGQGGAVLANNKLVHERVRRLTDHGGNWRESKIHEHVGGNFRMSDIQAAVGVSQMNRIVGTSLKRKRVHRWYLEELPVQVGWSVLYRSQHAEQLVASLKAKGIGCSQPYKPVRQSKPFYSIECFPGAEQAAKELVYLPSSPNLTRSQVKRVCREVKHASAALGVR